MMVSTSAFYMRKFRLATAYYFGSRCTCELNANDDCIRALEREYVFIQILKNFREYTDESLLPFYCFVLFLQVGTCVW